MRRIDIRVSEICTHFQTCSVTDKGIGEMTCGSTLSISPTFGKNPLIYGGIFLDRSSEELISPSQQDCQNIMCGSRGVAGGPDPPPPCTITKI